jgi:hypothetical protein
MKALVTPKQQLKPRVMKEVEREYMRRYQEHQNAIQKDITVQLLAAVLYTLNVCEGFGKKRLRRVFAEINGTFEDMSGVGFAGRFDADDLTELVREKFGIDLKAEVRVGECTCKGDRR